MRNRLSPSRSSLSAFDSGVHLEDASDSGNGLTAYMSKAQRDAYAAYLERIKQYEGTSIYQQLLNNPFYQEQVYEPGFFEGLLFNTFKSNQKGQQWLNDRITAGDEYAASLIDALRVQNYDDPASEVARRTAAGLNDDLSGGSQVGSGETPSVGTDDTSPSAVPEDTVAVAGQIAQLGINLFQSTFSMVSFLQDTMGKSLQNAAFDLDLGDKAFDQTIKLLAGSSLLPGTFEEYNSLSEEEKKGLDDKLIDQIESSIKFGDYKSMYSTRTARILMKRLRGTVSYGKDGRPTLAYQAYRNKLLAETYGDIKKSADVIGTPGFNVNPEVFGKAINDTFGKIDLAVRQFEQRIKAANATSAEAHAAYDQGYYTSDLGVSDRQADVASDTATVAAANRQASVDRLMGEVNQAFEQLGKKADEIGGLAGMFIKMFIPIARAQTEQIINDGFLSTFIGRAGGNTLKGLFGK